MFIDIFGATNQEVKEEIICLSDFFVEDFKGGAELTTEAILKASPFSVFKFRPSSKRSLQEQKDFVRANKNKTWILGNFSSMEPLALQELQEQGSKYVVIEYDYKYCAFRSPQLHQLQKGEVCNCHLQQIGRWMGNFYAGAKHVFFMSEEQRAWYLARFPFLTSNSSVQSSTWDEEQLDRIYSYSSSPRSERYAILDGASWLKATKQTVAWAQQNQLPFDLLGNMEYEVFVKELSKRKGLIFLPIGFDTCPRIVVEAQLMGLEIITNTMVQHMKEPWASLKGEKLRDELKKRPKSFWLKLSSVL